MEQEICNISWEEVERGVSNILGDIKKRNINVDTIVPILRGGAPLGNLISNNINADIAYIHIRRTTSNDINAEFKIPVLKGITNSETIEGKDILIVDDLLDKGVTMEFAIEELKKLKPKSIHVAVLYNFTKLENEEMYIVGLEMKVKKWIVFPWETKLV
jgi:hypoxanthine phosphoribosyltransferase